MPGKHTLHMNHRNTTPDGRSGKRGKRDFSFLFSTQSKTSPVSSFPIEDHSGGTSSLYARRQNLPLALGSADSVCHRAHHYLHHTPPRPHTRPRTLTTPVHATTLHSHMFPTCTAPPHSHLHFGYKQPVPGVLLVFASAATKDRATLHIHSTHSINTRAHPTPTRLGQVYTRALVEPSSSPHQSAVVC